MNMNENVEESEFGKKEGDGRVADLLLCFVIEEISSIQMLSISKLIA